MRLTKTQQDLLRKIEDNLVFYRGSFYDETSGHLVETSPRPTMVGNVFRRLLRGGYVRAVVRTATECKYGEHAFTVFLSNSSTATDEEVAFFVDLL